MVSQSLPWTLQEFANSSQLSTNQNWPYCIPHTFPALSAIYYTCEDSIIGTITVETNPSGQEPARVWNTLHDSSLSSNAASAADAGITTPTSAPTQSIASSGGTVSGSNTSTSTTSSDSQTFTERLSTRTIIGIAVGGFLLICGLVAAGIWLCLRRRKSHQASYQPPQGTYQYGPPPPLPPPTFVPAPYPPAGPVPKPFDGRPYPGYGGPEGHSQSNHHVTSPVSPVGSPSLPPSRYELNSSQSIPTSRYELNSTPRVPSNYAELPSGR